MTLNNSYALTQKTIKIYLANQEINETSFYESCLRLLKSLALHNLFSVEKCFNTGFVNKLEDLLLNDICFQYVLGKILIKFNLVILGKICESSYYKHSIYTNENLLNKIIKKFFENKNKKLAKYLLNVLVSLTEDDSNICKIIYDNGLMNVIGNYIRFYENEVKILAINLMINIFDKNNIKFENESLIIWSISILLNIIKEEVSTSNQNKGHSSLINSELFPNNNTTIQIKTNAFNILSFILKKSVEMQNIFYNIEGLDIILKELRSLFSDEKLKEFEEHAKIIKNAKSKKSEKVFLLEKEDDINSLNNHNSNFDSFHSLDEMGEYRRALLECLASSSSQKEESRKRIIESKELNIVFSSLEEPNPKILLSTANLILSLSRAHISIKKYLNEYDITGLLFKLSNHSNVEIQIAITNSLCNFLIDNSQNMSEILECVSKLLKILNNTKHNKIRYNAICAIKNIMFYVSSNRDTKKAIMKKVGYENLINFLDDEDYTIQEQALLIFRALLFKSTEDIEEVFSNCKAKLLKKVEEKLNSGNLEIILQTLYILCNISTGNEKQKAVVMETNFLKKVVSFLELNNESYHNNNLGMVKNSRRENTTSLTEQIKKVCLLVINNLLTGSDLDKRIAQMGEYNLSAILEIVLSTEEGDENEIKNIATGILGQLKNIKKI